MSDSTDSHSLSKKTAATAAVITATAVIAYVVVNEARLWFSKALHSSRGKESTTARQVFRDSPIPEKKPPKNHTHPLAAADRTCVSQYAEHFGLITGVGAYYVQQSMADVRHGRRGDRVMYWTKDVLVPPSRFAPRPRDLCVLVDVDYYVDIPQWLNTVPLDVMIYTIVPESVACEGEVSFTFNAANEMVYTVNGGAEYSHRLWNYYTDNFATVTWGWTGPIVRIWLVDSLRTSEHRAAILLTRSAEWCFWRGWLGWALLKTGLVSTKTLERLKVVQGNYLRLDVVEPQGIMRCTGRVNEFHAAKIPASSDGAIAVAARENGVKLAPATVQPYVSPTASINISQRGAIAALVDYHRDAVQKGFRFADKVGVGGAAVHRYQFGWDSYDPESKTALCAYMNPILDEAYSPDLCLGNEVAAVKTRILDVQTDIRVTPEMLQFMVEFLQILFPVAHEGHPASLDDVYAKQNRPSQRRILDEASWLTQGIDLVKSFLKREAYQEPKDPRVISTINGELKMKYSMYTYPLAAHFSGSTDCGKPGVTNGRHVPWYAFGFTPKEIALAVATLATMASTWTDSDLSRMDGRKSELLRDLERAALLRFYAPQYHAELQELHRRTFKVPGVTTSGHKYRSAYDQRSGSPDTAVFNTMDTAFIAFVAFRNMGFGALESFQKIGIYGGDDGGTPDVSPDQLAKAAASVGQKLTLNVFTRGQGGVSFLARYYSHEVWYGNANSMCDLARQLSKFHTTVVLPPGVTGTTKLLEKVDAFLLMDRNTPVIGEFCCRVREICPDKVVVADELHRLITPWGSQYAESDQYPNEAGPWMTEYAESALGVYCFDWMSFRTQLREARTIYDLMALRPVSVALPVPEVKDPVVVDGEVHAPPPKDKEEAHQVETPQGGMVEEKVKGVCLNPNCYFGKKAMCWNVGKECVRKERPKPVEGKPAAPGKAGRDGRKVSPPRGRSKGGKPAQKPQKAK